MTELAYKTDPLWIRLDGYPFDLEDAGLPFSRRLARENGWSHRFALKVIHEYRKFCYLALRSGHSVTPSEEVDQVWHLHLLYSREYWENFCPNVLEDNLHHGPTKGGNQEGDKFRDWYERTLESYRLLFGQSAPKKIWPHPVSRFRWADYHERVNTGTHWVIPKPFLLHSTGRKKIKD